MTDFISVLEAAIAKDRELRLHAPEIFIFSASLQRVREILSLVCALEAGKIDRPTFDAKIEPVMRGLCRVAEVTQRFEIVVPVTGYGQFSASFWRWFNWWNDYLKTLKPERIREMDRLAAQGLHRLNDYRPTGDWTASRHTPAFFIEILP